MGILLKISKGLVTSVLVAALCFASAVFTVLLYAKMTNQEPVFVQNDTQPVAYAEPAANDLAVMSEAEEEPAPVELRQRKSSVLLDAPHIMQYPELPRGCEVTTLAMLLQYAGYDTDKMRLAEEMPRDHTPIEYNRDGSIRFWGHPNRGFVGSITLDSAGFGMYHVPAHELMKTYTDRAVDLTGESFEILESYVSAGTPVMVWTTTNYRVPEQWVEWDSPDGPVRTTFLEHAVLLVGYDEKFVYLNDPLQNSKNKKVDKEQFVRVWEAMGKQALSYNGTEG